MDRIDFYFEVIKPLRDDLKAAKANLDNLNIGNTMSWINKALDSLPSDDNSEAIHWPEGWEHWHLIHQRER